MHTFFLRLYAFCIHVPNMSKKNARRPAAVSVPIRMSPELDAALAAAAAKVNLSKQDTMRLSLERGWPILIAQLASQPDTATEKAA
jgi:hypothetical protein